MEVFEGLGLAEHLTARSARFSALNLRGVAGARGRIDLLDLDWGDTDHPHWLTLPQYETERVLEDALSALGVQVEWATRFTGVAEEDDVVAATLTGPAGTEVVRSRWLLGADGGRSTVRDAIGGTLEREDAGATFILADAQTSASLAEDEGHLFLHPDGLLIIVPLPDPGRWRIIAHAPGESPAARTPSTPGTSTTSSAGERASSSAPATSVGPPASRSPTAWPTCTAADGCSWPAMPPTCTAPSADRA